MTPTLKIHDQLKNNYILFIQLFQQEENKMISNEMSSQLMIKEKELTKLKEDKKLLVKQFRERKQKKKIKTIPQVHVLLLE